MYANTNAKSFTISAINNDNADAKLQLVAEGGGFEYKLKVVGPFAITEGTDTSYGLVLDTIAKIKSSGFKKVALVAKLQEG